MNKETMLKAQWTQELSAVTKAIDFKILSHAASSYITNLDQDLVSNFSPKSQPNFSFIISTKIQLQNLDRHCWTKVNNASFIIVNDRTKTCLPRR